MSCDHEPELGPWFGEELVPDQAKEDLLQSNVCTAWHDEEGEKEKAELDFPEPPQAKTVRSTAMMGRAA